MTELTEVLYWVGKFAQWWFAGFVLRMLYVAKDRGQIKVEDLMEALVLGIVGPFLFVIWLIWKGMEFVSALNNALLQHRDRVLWRSKRKKTEHILYGKNTDKDSGN